MLPEKGRLAPFPTEQAVFLCSDDISVIERVCAVLPANSTTDFHLMIVPKISTIGKKILKDKGAIKQNDAPGKIKVRNISGFKNLNLIFRQLFHAISTCMSSTRFSSHLIFHSLFEDLLILINILLLLLLELFKRYKV